MPKRNLIESLLSKYLDGSIASEEKQQFYDLLADSCNEFILKELLLRNLNIFSAGQMPALRDPDFDRIFKKISLEIDQDEIMRSEESRLKRKSVIRQILAVTASAAAVFLIAFFVGRFSAGKVLQPVVATLTNTEIKAPYGSRSEITLPDGSKVILNAGSILSYKSDYNTANRNIDLTGEAYFKVAKNENLPLIVSAGSISIRAVGTEFNVKAYADEGIVETTLITGKVEIIQEGSREEGNTVDLLPNQKAIFIKDKESFVLEELKNSDSALVAPVKTILSSILIAPEVNVSQVVAWTEGKLILRGESLDVLCTELERKYDVKFEFSEEEIKKFRFTGVLLDETLEQVLNVIGLTAPIRYSLEGKIVTLSSDPHSINDFSKHMK